MGPPPSALRRGRAGARDRRRDPAPDHQAVPGLGLKPRAGQGSRPDDGRRRGLRAAALAIGAAWLLAASLAHADWLQPDPTFRDAQFQLRAALRDTVGRPDDAAAFDTLGVALLRLARTDEAGRVFTRVLAHHPADPTALGGLGKLAMFADRDAEAESLLAAAGPSNDEAQRDLYAIRLRRGEWSAAADLAEAVDDPGRIELLHRLAEQPPYRVTASPAEARLLWERAFPVPLVKVKLNGQQVLMAIDLGSSDLLVDPMWASRARLTLVPGQSQVFWCGSRLAVRHALVARLELGGARVEQVPAGVVSLRKWSVEANPQGEQVAGVIGINLLRRFTPTLDFKRQRLELRPLATPAGTVAAPGASRVPFELWGENEMAVRGTIGASRRLSLVVQTAYPACGVAAPTEVFQELGIKAGTVGRALKGTGAWLQGHALTPVTVSAVSVGPVARNRLPGWSDGMDATEMWRHGVRRDAVLAQMFFDDARVTIDWAKHELLVEQ